MKKFIALFLMFSCMLALVGCTKRAEESEGNTITSNIETTENTEDATQNEVYQYLYTKYNLMFKLYGPEGHDLYVFNIYPDRADYECHIMMPANTDDIEQYWNDLEWKIVDDKLIITNHIGGEWTEAFKIDINTETATSQTNDRVYKIYAIDPDLEIVPTEAPILDCKSLEEACKDSFIDPSKVSVLGGEWAYTADPNKFVALATVRYTDKDNEYQVADIVMVGTFGGKTELFHHLNEHSPYTRENALQEFGAVDDQRYTLE